MTGARRDFLDMSDPHTLLNLILSYFFSMLVKYFPISCLAILCFSWWPQHQNAMGRNTYPALGLITCAQYSACQSHLHKGQNLCLCWGGCSASLKSKSNQQRVLILTKLLFKVIIWGFTSVPNSQKWCMLYYMVIKNKNLNLKTLHQIIHIEDMEQLKLFHCLWNCKMVQ